MDSTAFLLLDGLIMVVVGFFAGYVVRQHFITAKTRVAEVEAEKLIAEASAQQKDLLLQAKDQALELRQSAESEVRERRTEVQQRERRLQQREEQIEQKLAQVENRDRGLSSREEQIAIKVAEAEQLRARQVGELERISGLTRDEAKDIIITRVEQEVRTDVNRRVREVEHEAREDAEMKGRKLIALAVQRYAAEQVAETTLSVVPIPSEEMKGRIIGREGRNIRALEAATGVDLIIDDTPDAVTLSGFDPIRREIARIALNKLVVDGRIHPGRIEEIVAKAKQEVENQIRQDGEQASYEAGLAGLHPEIMKVMGRMKFRTSYGQNQLQHSVEAAHVAAMMAAELGADVAITRRAAFLHDIGKVLTHEVEGPHHIIGAEYAKRFGETQAVCDAIAGHHDHDPDYQTMEAVIVQAADAASGSRPGARRESVEQYVKRLEALEGVANSFEGVERSFAIQAGREVRVIIKPEQLDDLEAVRLARDIVKRIEETLQYPGQVKVTVVRETRAIEYAR